MDSNVANGTKIAQQRCTYIQIKLYELVYILIHIFYSCVFKVSLLNQKKK